MNPLFILDIMLLPFILLRLLFIYFYGSRYNIEGFRFLDVMMHAENKYFNQEIESEPTINIETEDVRRVIKYDSYLYNTIDEKSVNKIVNKKNNLLLDKNDILGNGDGTKEVKNNKNLNLNNDSEYYVPDTELPLEESTQKLDKQDSSSNSSSNSSSDGSSESEYKIKNESEDDNSDSSESYDGDELDSDNKLDEKKSSDSESDEMNDKEKNLRFLIKSAKKK